MQQNDFCVTAYEYTAGLVSTTTQTCATDPSSTYAQYLAAEKYKDYAQFLLIDWIFVLSGVIMAIWFLRKTQN